jgi:uncharacterized protein (DUF1697 family)
MGARASQGKRRYVCLLRGINLGARNRVPMSRLRQICEAEGCEEVQTYIASGNVVLTSSLSPAIIGRRLERAIETEFRINIKVAVFTEAQLTAVVKNNPFPDAEPGTVHVAFAAQPITKAQIERLRRLHLPPEELGVRGRHIYFHLPNGYGRARLPTEIDRVVGKATTVRNWRTVLALNEMASNH